MDDRPPREEGWAPALASLLDAAVASSELWGGADTLAVSVTEAACIAHAAPARRTDFSRGRHCARQTLAKFGIADFDLLPGQDRAPVWPPGFIGSITHTVGYCAAAVAREAAILAIGIDAELLGGVTADLFPQIFTRREAEFLNSLDSTGRTIASTVMFSAKEAYFKAQHPHTGMFLEFHAVEVLLNGGAFQVRRTAGGSAAFRQLEGCFKICGPIVLTAVSPAFDAPARWRCKAWP